MLSTGTRDRERESILAGVDDGDDEMRRLAVERLLSLPLAEALPRLVTSLGDPSWRVRKAVIERLVACRDAEAAGAALIEALGDGENSARRNAAVEALIELGGRVVDILVEALATEDVDVRKLLVDAIGGIGSDRGHAAMIEALGDPEPNVRAAAADALGAIGGREGVAALTERARDEEELHIVRLSALQALCDLEAKLGIDLLEVVVRETSLAAAGFRLLGAHHDTRAVDLSLRGLAARGRATREAAIEALLRLLAGCDACEVDDLEARIRDTAADFPELLQQSIDRVGEAGLAMRLHLIQFLGILGEPAVVLPILDAGRDEAIESLALGVLEGLGETSAGAIDRAWDELDAEVRPLACAVLGRVGGRRATLRLLDALDSHDIVHRIAAARALAMCGDHDALAVLLRRLEKAAHGEEFEADEETAALVDAVVEICLAPDRGGEALIADAVEMLASQLTGADEAVRVAIASVLGRIGRGQDAEHVASLMKDPSDAVRRAAVEALARFAGSHEIETLRLALADESPRVRSAAGRALVRSERDDLARHLERLLCDDDARVRAATLRAIGTANPSALSDQERARLIGSGLEDSGAVCMAAIEAMTIVGGVEAAVATLPLLEHREPEIVQAAVRCVGRHGEPEQLESLLAAVSHEHWSVRAEAVELLADRRFPRAVPAILRRLEIEQDGFVRDAMLHGLGRLEAWTPG